MTYTNGYNNLCTLLGVPRNASKKTINKAYRKALAKSLSGEMSFNDFYRIKELYLLLMNYYAGEEERKNEERNNQKRLLEYYTEMTLEEYKERKRLEETKGMIYLFLEDLKEIDIEDTIDDFIDCIKSGVMEYLDDDNKKLYNEFLCLFLKLWKKVYEHVLVVEKNILKQDRFSEKTSVSFGEDEITDTYYNRNKCYNPYGKFSRLLELSKHFSMMIPEEGNNYFLDAHLALMASYFKLGYGVSKFNDTPIYSFVVNTRLEEFKREYYDLFDEERRRGIRKSPFVDNNELLGFVEERLNEFNKQKGYSLEKGIIKA